MAGRKRATRARAPIQPPPTPAPAPEELPDPREGVMTLGDHLEELRRRILWSLGILGIFSIAAGFFISDIHRYISEPYHRATGLNMMLGSAMDALNTMIQLSVAVGFAAGLPVVIFMLFEFVTPAMERRTAIYARISMVFSCLLFWGGVLFCWFYIFPLSVEMMFKFLLPPNTQALISLDKYYSFFFILHIGTGVTFQLPLLIVILGALGVVPISLHRRAWRFVIVGMFLLSMAVTPGDPVSLFVVALPLCVFYAIAVAIVYMIERNREKAAARDAAEA